MSSHSIATYRNVVSLRARLRACALTVVCLLLAATMAWPAIDAYADVKKSDIVYGGTVDALGLTVAQCPDISSDYAIVMDSNGTIIYERNADTETQIASITKVMTAIVSIENGNASDEITVSSYAAEIGESSAGLQAGDTMTLETALMALMIPSGNDAAEALCEHYGKKMCEAAGNTSPTDSECVEAFVKAMNDTAAKIGMTNSVFTNPHGLDDGVYADELHSTARDVAKMCQYAMQKSEFRNVVNKETADITVMRDGAKATITLTSTDELLGVLEGQCGVKTGYTDSAGACFAGAVNRNGKDLYTVCLHAPDELTRFTDTRTLVEWYYEHLIDYKIINTTEYTYSSAPNASGSMPVIANIAHADYVDKTIKATFDPSTTSLQVFDLHGNVSQKLVANTLSGNVKAGDVVGYVVFLQHNEEVGRVNLIATESVDAPDVLTSITTAVDRFFRGITGKSTEATSYLVNTSTLINDKVKTS